jgi:phenylpyruvate tautomerase PptA (4-oxalocrotonate tautomerase family)
MPTYTIYARAETFTGGQRDALARAVTAAHSEHTGAPRSFVQTIFRPVEPGTHYIGAEPADPRGVWVYGHIRRGRSPEVRTALAEGIRDALEAIAQVPPQFIWVYLNELAHTDMIEFGSVLPVPGEEAAWVEGMDPALRDQLRALG